jgi:hypothetical protein
MPTCIEWGQERHQECTQTRDEGYNQCTQTRDDGYNQCCTWEPCSWFCRAWVWISNIVCIAWTWVSNVVCVAWTWVTTAVCVVWDVVTTVVGAIITILESTIGWLLSAIAFVVELIMAIPILGTVIRWVINAITAVVGIILSICDAFLGLIGVRPEKLLRVCTVILRDEKGTPVATVPEAVSMLQLAADVYKRDANIRIIPSRPFQFHSGFAGAETVDETWVETDGANSDAALLDVECGAGGEWGETGSGFQLKSSLRCLFGAWRRLSGFGAPITVFYIRSIPGALGCSLWITNYVTIDGQGTVPHQSPRTVGHELGHSCNLWHVCVDDGIRNMMATSGACSPESPNDADRVNPLMEDWQVLLVRASKHVSYF